MRAQDPTGGGGRDAVAEAAQFTLDPHDSPGRVLGSEAQDQSDYVVWCWWVARRFGLALFGGDQSAVPAQQRFRCDDAMGAKRLGYEPG
jgi:hypothetical protein